MHMILAQLRDGTTMCLAGAPCCGHQAVASVRDLHHQRLRALIHVAYSGLQQPLAEQLRPPTWTQARGLNPWV